ncbi:MAG: T9SS type A sorting domain-containing protein [candidate division WOR-3 bacterium]
MGKIVKFLILNLIVCNLGIVLAIGRQDVIGYTTYDWQMGGPMTTRCRTDSVCNGIHVSWVASNFNPSTDRNQGYNYYNFTTHQWHWPVGMNIYPQISGFGNLDYDPITGVAIASTHQSVSGGLTITCAKDQSPGAGTFVYCQGPLSYRNPVINVSHNQAIHCIMLDTTIDTLWYARIQPWCNWTTPLNISTDVPPYYLSYNIAASKISNKVVVVWRCLNDPYPERAFYRISNDGGINWDSPVQLPFPPAQGITPCFDLSGLFAMFDYQDNLHIVTSVSDTGFTVPAAIWHFCPINNPQWSLVYHYAPQTLNAPVGYNAIFATRPTIVQSPTTNHFYVTWEQFDSLNYEPSTYLTRADIWIAESPNNGQTWHNQQSITIPNTTSKRFPCAGGVFADTLVISYLIDSIAGFAMITQGRATLNPVICHFIPLPYAGIEQDIGNWKLDIGNLSTSPNPFTSQTTIHYSLPIAGKVSLHLYNASGRLVKILADEHKPAGNYFITLDSKNLSAGLYFCKLNLPNKSITLKILKIL